MSRARSTAAGGRAQPELRRQSSRSSEAILQLCGGACFTCWAKRKNWKVSCCQWSACECFGFVPCNYTWDISNETVLMVDWRQGRHTSKIRKQHWVIQMECTCIVAGGFSLHTWGCKQRLEDLSAISQVRKLDLREVLTADSQTDGWKKNIMRYRIPKWQYCREYGSYKRGKNIELEPSWV